MRIGLLTGGGDVPGLNAAIRAVVKHAEELGHRVIGFRDGWKGLAEGEVFPLGRKEIRNVISLGGTLLGSARFHPGEKGDAVDEAISTLEAEKIDALIVIGGDGTISAAETIVARGIKVVAIPKTIDNDVACTDRSIGFDTAVSIATEAIDRIHTTAESHNRVMLVEVMGRTAGWIAATAGIAGGAEIVLAPERPFDINQIIKTIKHRHRAHASFSIIVVAEGAFPKEGTGMDDFNTQYGRFGDIVPGSVTEQLKNIIEERTGFETRVTVLGHTQRGGSPTAADRILASRFGIAAVDAIDKGEFSVMTALHGDDVVLVPLSEVVGKVQHVPDYLLDDAEILA